MVFCSSRVDDKSISSERIDAIPAAKDSTAFYFPLKDSSKDKTYNDNSLDTFVNIWYSKMLFALNEPVLYNYTGNIEVYRFTLLRTFDNPVAVRLQSDGKDITLYSKVSNGASGYEPGEIILDTSIQVTKTEWNNFKSLISRTEFWRMPSNEDEKGGRDGSEWILEGMSSSNYHWVSRWSPSQKDYSHYMEACEYLISLSRIQLDGRLY
jgi:hypothetical protein